MGSPLSPVLANIFMEDLETRALETFPWKPKMWRRYVDDVLVIWPHGDQRLKEFHLHLNGQNLSIQFTLEKESEGRIAFLDVQLERRGAGVLTSVFRKKTHTDQYLNFNSNHPTKVKRGIIQCLRHRAEKVCSGSTRWKELGHLRQVFKANAYPETVVNRNLRARPTPRISTQTSQTSPKLLLLPYIPGISERIEKTCQPLGVKTVSRPKCTLRSALVHVKQPREDKRKKVSFMKFHAKIAVCLHWRNRQNP